MPLRVRLCTRRSSHHWHWLGQLKLTKKGLTYCVTGGLRRHFIPFELKNSGKLPLRDWALTDPDEVAGWAQIMKIAFNKG